MTLPKTLAGMRFSAALLFILGVLFGIYVPFFCLVLVVLVYRRTMGTHPFEASFALFVVCAILGAAALSLLCIRAGNALARSRRWAAYVAIIWGFILICFGGGIIIDLFRPYQPGAVHGEDMFGLITGVPCILLGVWWCVYLNLPHVRRHLKTANTSTQTTESLS